MALPRLNLSLYTDGDSTQRQKLASDLLQSLSQHGFVRLTNHGFPDEFVGTLFESSRSFFQLQSEHKEEIINHPGPNPQRGWSRVGAENSATLYRKGLLKSNVSESLKDAREHFDFAASTDTDFPNKWPRDDILPGFRTTMETAFRMLEDISKVIVEAVEMALGLAPSSLVNRITHDKNASEMRILRYPEIELEEIRKGHVSRIWPHFDLGVITLLFQDGVGGLEFEDRTKPGTFLRVDTGARSDLIVNVSETLQRWTNDRIPAGLHQVNVPESLKGRDKGTLPERYSITYFCKADRAASVGPLNDFVESGSMSKYKEMTAIDYHQQRLLSAY